jgi:hypothetical protein
MIQQIRSLYLGLDNGLQTSPDVVMVCGITSKPPQHPGTSVIRYLILDIMIEDVIPQTTTTCGDVCNHL